MSNVFADFLLNKGLYDSQEISQGNIDELIDLVDGNIKLDCYCKDCKEKRVFRGISIKQFWLDEERDDIHERKLSECIGSYQKCIALKNMPSPCQGKVDVKEWEWINWQIEEDARLMVFKFVCSMDKNHHLDFAVIANQHEMVKIGQYPSVADLSFPELKRYQKVISEKDMKEMRRAIGLHAQGIGVGSYVYLRRVVERLIYQAQNNAVSEGAVEKEEIEKHKVADRIKKLKGYLPDFMIKNATIYGIVSKGIHQLSEEECLEYFPVLQECIFMILEKWEEDRSRKDSEKKLSAAISKISFKLRKEVEADL